ncbi:hypothetical protein CW731_14585 [Polaribacter sp. ALD11]|uniref:hypothetical protein n=1 Tax=Polaribacter sp. ALD11 TaxID=2058137 RepID=UPI000C31B742|nr:hypothetical protein [Polaribacter sp. ALD11]AUC86429.1 hypothetical protein CW731_14585 [Polaribacter sp. ALD11]
MVKNTHLHDNFEVNFTLKGFTSILIGVYFFLLAYAYKYILDSFLIEDHALGLLSAQIIEIIFISLAAIFVLFSSFSLFFSGRRNVKRFQQQLWNGKTKAAFRKYLIGILIVFSVLIFLMNKGLIDLITPVFLIQYSIFLFIFKNKTRKNLLFLSGISLLLGIYCLVIPGYWYSSLTILGIAHATYGIVER